MGQQDKLHFSRQSKIKRDLQNYPSLDPHAVPGIGSKVEGLDNIENDVESLSTIFGVYSALELVLGELAAVCWIKMTRTVTIRNFLWNRHHGFHNTVTSIAPFCIANTRSLDT